MIEPAVEKVGVLVIGGGPAGLTAAARLAPRAGASVVVLEREAAAGGIPRHSDHLGYGVRDLRRFLTGPDYARRLTAAAVEAGADVRTRHMVTGWSGDEVEVTSPQGRCRLRADAVVLATGARERPRPARLIPGDRPSGVYTTGALQNLVHLAGGRLSGRAIVLGAELVSWSAVLTLRHAGADPVLMVSGQAVPECYAPVTFFGRTALGVPITTSTRLARIIGRRRLEAVELEHLHTGARTVVRCDILVLTGDWIPDHELARSAGLEMDAGSRGPLVDAGLSTSRAGVFAIGNLVHPVDTADIAAIDGRRVVSGVLDHLAGRRVVQPGVGITAAAPLRWVMPGRWRPGIAPARGRLLAWSDDLIRLPRVRVQQDGVVRGSLRLPWPVAPGRIVRIPASVLDRLDPAGGPARVEVR